MILPWHRPVFRLVASDRCRVALPWFRWAHAGDAASALRRRANALERRRLGAGRRLEAPLAALLYALLGPLGQARALRKWGRALRAAEGVSLGRQWRDLQACAWRHGLRPEVYYYLGLHRCSRAVWGQFLDPAELHHLQRDISPDDFSALEDKLLFHRRATAHGLPTPALLAVWRDGARDASAGGLRPLRGDLFVKRARSYSSIGVRGYRYDPGRGEHCSGGRRLDAAALAAELDAASRGFTLLVQPWLRNHPGLADFSSGALCNCRIVTGRHPDGRVEPVLAAFRFPLGSELTCAERDLTLCAAIDLASGRLHAAGTKHPRLGRLARHPLTGRPIEGAVLPGWPALLALAVAAHAGWPEFPFIGWDIAPTADGPVVLEGGCLWGGYLAQMSGNPPLGLTPFPAIYLSHLRRRAAPVACLPS
jgi:hypothetical protein